MNGSEEQGELTGAIAAVMQDVRFVEKGGNNTHFKFRFAGVEDVTGAVHDAMAKHGVVVTPSSFEIVERVENKGGDLYHCRVGFIISHSSGQWREVVVASTGQDKNDKALFKALSGAQKYALRLAFTLPATDDPDKYEPEPEPEPPKEWTHDERKRFIGRLNGVFKNLQRDAPRYEDVKATLEAMGRGRPATWEPRVREAFFKGLEKEGGRFAEDFLEKLAIIEGDQP